MPKDNFEIHCSLRDNFINGARNLSDGQFYFFVSGLNDTGEILFQIWFNSVVNRDQITTYRENISSAILNSALALVSLLLLALLPCRRCEPFIFCSLLLILIVSSITAISQIRLSNTVYEKINFKTPFVTILLSKAIDFAYIHVVVAGMLLYAWLHGMFAFQYLRASLTVPIHFNRRMRLDSGFTSLLPELDKSIVLRTCLIILLQVATGLACILLSVIRLYPRAFELYKD